MKKLRTSALMLSLAIVPTVLMFFILAIILWIVSQIHIAIAIAIALVPSSIVIIAMYFISDKGIKFNDEKFELKDGRTYYYKEIEEIRIKNAEIEMRPYKVIVIRGEEVCRFDDHYHNAKQFKEILKKHGFDVKYDSLLLN